MSLIANNKTYIVTNNYNKPYLHISNSILPLTTIGGGVIRCKDNNGNTYRPLEYKSTSSSESNSWYTSAVNSNGMYDTTALTRASTSGTSYLTTTNSLNKSFIASESLASIYSNSRTMTSIRLISMANVTSTRSNTAYTTISTKNKTQAVTVGIRTIYTAIGVYGSNVTSYDYVTGSSYGTSTSGITSYTFATRATNMMLYYTTDFVSSYYARFDIKVFSTIDSRSIVVKYTGTESTLSYDYEYASNYTFKFTHSSLSSLNLLDAQTITTGTSYLTRSSTSGYTGKSSSSSSIETSSWL